ncbi:MAG: phosphoglucosamine mutase [Cytophagales bacterium]|nr:phosphoglucosamine mutase [Armatimonadota bacterium]
MRHHFGTDGVRGIANTELSPQLALSLGAAAALTLKQHAQKSRPRIVVGRDPRVSGDLLGAALMAGICSQGVDVVDIGVVPTPGVAHAARKLGAAAGVVISASHNPVRDNGIKFFGPDGKKLADRVEAEIEGAMADWESQPRPSGGAVGRITRTSEPVAAYAEFLVASLAPFRLDGLKIVIDCANGAASPVAAGVLERLGATVIALSSEPDGVNINEGCGSLHPESMAARVAAEEAFAGMAFDGDADRVILADEAGRIFDGDRILCTLGLFLAAQDRLTNRVVVGTVMSNLGLEQALAKHEIRLVRAPVGDRYVTEQMAAHQAAVGGEKSGHILLPHLSSTGDGILTGLHILRICQESGRSLAAWADEMTELPQKLVNIPVRQKEGWDAIPEVADALRAAERRLEGRGRIFVRPSGTEKLIRVMAEGPDAAEVDALTATVADALRAHRGV